MSGLFKARSAAMRNDDPTVKRLEDCKQMHRVPSTLITTLKSIIWTLPKLAQQYVHVSTNEDDHWVDTFETA